MEALALTILVVVILCIFSPAKLGRWLAAVVKAYRAADGERI